MTEPAELLKIQNAAKDLVESLVSASGDGIVAVLKPRPEDYARVFVAGAAQSAQEGYAEMWSSPPPRLGKPGQTQVKAVAIESSTLTGDNEHSRKFPGGYQKIAHQLKPGLVWVAFQLVAPGESDGMSFDGLVYLDDHWAWFPKPWRVLAAADTAN